MTRSAYVTQFCTDRHRKSCATNWTASLPWSEDKVPPSLLRYRHRCTVTELRKPPILVLPKRLLTLWLGLSLHPFALKAAVNFTGCKHVGPGRDWFLRKPAPIKTMLHPPGASRLLHCPWGPAYERWAQVLLLQCTGQSRIPSAAVPATAPATPCHSLLGSSGERHHPILEWFQQPQYQASGHWFVYGPGKLFPCLQVTHLRSPNPTGKRADL